MERVGVLLFSFLALAVSLQVGFLRAAVTLPPEDELLDRHFYKKPNGTCPNVDDFVRHQVTLFWMQDRSITAKLFKLLYADCMVNGCDASILLDGKNTEKKSPLNAGLGEKIFILIDKIKTVVEQRCPGVVSCADILNLATRDAAHLGHHHTQCSWEEGMDLGQVLHGLTTLTFKFLGNSSELCYFERTRSAGSGAHTMGTTHCQYIRDRLYNFNNTGKPDPKMDKSLLKILRNQCPQTTTKGTNDPVVYLNPKNGPKYEFTNNYYKGVKSYKAVLGIDQQQMWGNYSFVDAYAKSFEAFRQEFALSISRMGGLKVLTGTNGEIRKNCRVTNRNNPSIK
ncbi:OLC1v1008286C1 [Oldenlandia corymbosa var. corymbosa]|uniref:Peroxidase n=1 Tax=Oldenlandia corymbosa var. corymbosa TaxID=529605 RepID=A0AAV1DPF0_OLDCO|nr:OLC1v1008286C1 [Oldenlandia corymbosa var. corymbosa]